MFTHRLLTEGFREDEVSQLLLRLKANFAWNIFLPVGRCAKYDNNAHGMERFAIECRK